MSAFVDPLDARVAPAPGAGRREGRACPDPRQPTAKPQPLTAMLASCALAQHGGEVTTADPTRHFDPKGQMPSKFTIELQERLRDTLPFDDERDFEEASKGFIAAPDYKQIKIGRAS
ncbi:MAG: hypothetical protein ACF8R7_05325, partial [Phycisphaerales bacterium JB039]